MRPISVRLGGILCAIALLAPGRASAESPARDAPDRSVSAHEASARVEADAGRYCEWVRAAAASEAAPLLTPSLFVSGGVVGGPDAGPGATALPPTPRLTAGASYSLSGLLRGVAVSDRADAECALHRSEAVIRAFVQAYRDGESRTALAAALAVYEEAEPRALELFERQKSAAAAGRATAVDLTDAQMRLDELRARIAQARRELSALGARTAPSPKEVAAAIAAQPAQEAEVERDLARIRRTAAWDLSVRGGYDRFFGVRDHVPVFGTVTLTVNVGLLFQPSADRRAIEGREAWAKSQIEGPFDRARQAATKLRALRDEARARRDTTAALVADLEQRRRSLEAIATDGARTAAAAVWFSLVHARAQNVFYAALVTELDAALAGVA